MNDTQTASQAQNTNPTTRVREALARTKALLPDYWSKCLAQRAHPDASSQAAGSVYVGRTAVQVEEMLLGAAWEPYKHPSVMAGCSAFRAPLPGNMGLVALNKCPSSARVRLIDPKGTGTVEAALVAPLGPAVEHTVAILGDEEGQEVCFTFHPGDPVRPSTLSAKDYPAGTELSAGEAWSLGLEWAKVVGP